MDRAGLRRRLEVLAIRRKIAGHGIDELRVGQRGERALVFNFQNRQGQLLALRSRAFPRRHAQDRRQFGRHRCQDHIGGSGIAAGKPKPPDAVARSAGLMFEQQREGRPFRKLRRVFQLEDRLVRLAVAWMNSPLGVVFSIDRLRGGNGDSLVVIGDGAHERKRVCSLARRRERGEGTKL